MNSPYLGSEYHKENVRKYLALGRKKAFENRLIKIEQYKLNPNLCPQCSTSIEYVKRNNRFCSRSCGAIYTNLKKPPKSEETKLKISITLKGRKPSPADIKSHQTASNKLTIGRKIKYYLNPNRCKICAGLILYINRNRKTCSRECSIISSTSRTYLNGSKKYFYYKGIALESSWELEIAQLLDLKNINWNRPKPINYFDKENKSRMYYPDFYLSKFNIYLDPKNQYCMNKDSYKMEQISNQVNIVYGNINKIKDFINSLDVG